MSREVEIPAQDFLRTLDKEPSERVDHLTDESRADAWERCRACLARSRGMVSSLSK